MAHILFVSPYYPPEKAAAAVCVSENARRLVQLGHRVTVLTTFPNYPTGRVPFAYRGSRYRWEMLDGVRVLRVWSYTSANKGFWLRLLAHLSFGLLVPLLAANKLPRPDCLIVQSPPLFDAFAARILATLKRCRFVFMVSDLWPEAAIQLGVLRHPLLIALAEWLERSTYRRADLVWAVTAQMQQALRERGVPAERVCLIPNGVDTLKFAPRPRADARRTLGWDERFTVLYMGTHGLSHGLRYVLHAAVLLQQQQSAIRLLLIGDGAEKPALVALARQLKLSNVEFMDPVPHEQVPLYLAAADICLAHTRNLPLFRGMLPIKLLEAMACARPVILALNGEACVLAVHEAHAAVHVEPENAPALAAAILQVYEQPELAQALGEHGRDYVVAHFSYDMLAIRLNEQLERLLS